MEKQQVKKLGWILVLAMTAWLGGCASDATKESSVDEGAAGRSAETTPAASAAPATGSAMSGQADLLSKRRVHFGLDSNAIDDEAREIIKAHAAYLTANPSIKVKFEGHCDERGSREYNLALGERRAQAVEKMMKVLGVTAGRLSNSSYGEEKPLDAEHNESAWRLNRRVEIIY